MVINEKHFKTVLYLDDNKLPRVWGTVMTDILEQIQTHFGYLTIMRGKKDLLLVMDITLENNGNWNARSITGSYCCICLKINKGVSPVQQVGICKM